MNFKILMVSAFCMGFFLHASAQENILRLSVSQAQEYAVAQNKELQNAREDIGIAEQQYRETRGQGLPQINGTLDYMTNFNYEAVLDFGGGESTASPQIDYSKLDAGDLEILKFLQGMTASSPSTIVMTDQSNASVQVSQLIFGGQYWVGMQTARIGRELARQSVNITELDVRESVTGTYQLILVSEQIIDVLDGNIRNMEEIRQHTRNMYAAGMAEQTDVDQISISLSQLENQKKSMERNVRLNYNMLRFQMGLESGREIILTDSLQGLLNELESVSGLSSSFNMAQNPSYKMIQMQLHMQEKMVDMEKWAYAPVLTGFYSYTEKIMTTGFDISPKNAAGLNLDVPIFSSGMRKAKVDKAKIELDKVMRNKEMVEEQLNLQNDQFRYELTNAYDNYYTQQRNINVARRVLKSVQNKFRQGLVSSLDLTQANSNYLEAESNYLNAAMELMQANLKLERLYNEL